VTLLKRDRARSFRKYPTTSEARAWEILRDRRVLGLKFRRQHVIDGYVVDFCCVEHRLVLEIDGEIHLDPVQREWDTKRSLHLQGRGYFILRIRNRCVNKRYLEKVLNIFLGMGLPSPASRERGRG
ncbi:MAG TPA: endonuclease domain-containing protein, partial [Gemmatimonadales bacterium]|nr:endonuclease domain-containing protein [Gemmatimonadales bacterium]